MCAMIKVDARDAIKKLNAQYGHVSNNARKLATARAINHTLAKAKTAINREIRGIYALDQKTVSQGLSQIKADRLTLTGMVKAKGKPITLAKFRARQTQKGVSVEIKKGRRKVIPGVFLVTTRSGHTGVMFRGKYNGRQMQRRKNRIAKTGPDLPISEMMGVSIPAAMANDVIIKHMDKAIQSDFIQRFDHEIKRVALPI